MNRKGVTGVDIPHPGRLIALVYRALAGKDPNYYRALLRALSKELYILLYPSSIY